jgi:5-methyltetrahydrofolate--homocysteine methyltransferase
LAIRAAKENTALEVICTFTFNPVGENEFRTMMGVSPAEAAIACIAAGADIIGTNCGTGTKNMISIVAQMREAAPDTPIMIQANAGLPEVVDGKVVYPETPEQMKALVPQIIAAGANIIGGCCGTNPEHIYQIHQAVNACTTL